MDYGFSEGGNVGPWCPPGVSFNDNPMYEVKVKPKPAISLAYVSVPSIEGNMTKGSPLLALPLEIRLNIYRWVHLMGPMRRAELAPWYPSPVPSEYLMRSVLGHDASLDEVDGAATTKSPSQHSRLLGSSRPLTGLPTALLRANRQIYSEARTIPFMENEFVFVNWFSSGLWAARALARSLRPWQIEAMRWVRLEVMERGLEGGTSSEGSKEWLALCDAWAKGIRGLRLKIVGGGWVGEQRDWIKPIDGSEDDEERGFLYGWNWDDGLLAMERLERVEIEIELAGWDNEDKVAWCRRLEERLHEKGSSVEIVCTERVKAGSCNWAGCKICTLYT